MKIVKEKSGQFVILRFPQANISLNFLNKNILTEYLDDLVQNKCYEIAVDFKNIAHLDTSAIGGLVKIYKNLLVQNGHLILFNANKKLMVTFQLTKINNFLNIFPSEEKFKKHFNIS